MNFAGFSEHFVFFLLKDFDGVRWAVERCGRLGVNHSSEATGVVLGSKRDSALPCSAQEYHKRFKIKKTGVQGRSYMPFAYSS
jgi:hypothetical protein